MGVELLEIGNKMRKGVIFTIRGCFRSVCNHPFLVCVLCVLIFVYRSSPFIFSLLVSAFPVLVCTAVLLGTLLCFGQPNIPEIEIEENKTHEAVPIKTAVSRDSVVVERNESYYVERYSGKRREEAVQPTKESSLSESKLDEICREASAYGTASLIKEGSGETELENGETWVANRELDDKLAKQKSEWNESDGEVMENHYTSIPKGNDEHLESEYEKSEADSFDSERVNVDSLEAPPRSAWKQVEHQEDEEEEEDDALDSGSDRAESSSPDASMADIIPMLDELHPLLDEEVAQPVQISHVGSDAASEQSSQSTSSIESVDETENHEDSEVADDDNEDGEDDDDDDDAQGDKEDQTKSVITWTEEDQKNLMDLGSSEIERNRRLENLILRRRTRKNMSMVPEINLIDLESSDFPFNVAPISTARRNPFDLPDDSYDNSGLPPIPGSAPSILLPRRNPFDISYDSSEGKPDLVGDEFREELKALQSREPFFRRRETFNVGPSVFAPNRQERQDVKLRPYFFPEQMVLEESSYLMLQRQPSEMSESKASSVPETESVSSVEDLEDQKLEEADECQELEVNSTMGEVIEDQDQISKREFSEEDVPYEPELISDMKHVSEHVEHGSQSSEEEESLELGSVENRYTEVNNLRFRSQDVEKHYEEGIVARPMEVQATGYNSSSEAVEQRYSRGSSASSLSEVSERVFTEIDGESLSILDGRSHGVAVEPDISRQTSDLSITSTLVDDVPHKEPVYDSSPSAVGKNFSSSSSSSDVHAESDPGFPPLLVKRTVSECLDIEKDIPTNIEMLPEPPKLHLADERDSVGVDSNTQVHDNIHTDLSGEDQRSGSQGASEVPGVLCHAFVSSNSCLEASVDENLTDQKLQGDKNLGPSEEEKHLPISERGSPIPVGAPPVGGQLKIEHLIDKGQTVLSPNSDADYHEANEKLISTPSAGGSTSFFYDIRMHEPDFEHLDEDQVPNTPVESFEKVWSLQNLPIPEFHDVSPKIKSPLIPDSVSRPSSASEEAASHVDTQTMLEEADEIKEIDEGLLSELDSVGDFGITRWESGSHELEKHIDCAGERSSSAHSAETSSTKVVEVNSIEENKIKHEMHLRNSRDEIDIYKEHMKRISDIQTSQTITAEHIDTSSREFSKSDGSAEQIKSQNEGLLKEIEAQPANPVLNRSIKDDISGIPEVDMQEVPKRAELTSVEAEVMTHHYQVDLNSAPGMPEPEFSDKEIKKHVVLDPPQPERVIGETTAERFEQGTLHVNTSVIESTHETPILEARTIDYAHSDSNQADNGNIEIHRVHNSAYNFLHVVHSGETQGTSELHVAETIPSEGTISPPKNSLDVNSQKELKPNTNNGSPEVKAGTLDSSVAKESSAREVSSVTAEKPDHEVKTPEDLHSTTSAKEKGNSSKSSSSSSSSSSESSSSDSEEE